MANSLLDFVMSLVRDPEAAARYAADPAGVLADAQLGAVTSVDVDNLLPVVAESLSMNGPSYGAGGFGEAFAAEPAGNVWASGAATAAFDAFDDHLPAVADTGLDVAMPDRVDIDTAGADLMAPASVPVDDVDTSLYYAEPLVDDVLPTEIAAVDDWAGPVGGDAPAELDDHGPAFDVFD